MKSLTHTVIGIDLGTTYSVVAAVGPTGQPRTIVNAEGELTTPSVVFIDGATIVVGSEAVKAAAYEPEKSAEFVKRDMGCPLYSRQVDGTHLPPEVIQSLILEKLHRDAEEKLGPVTKAVITVPAYFNEPRRKATQDAGRLAGLEVLDIINEPTAAAIAYGVQEGFISDSGEARREEQVLVYDLGGGTFDVTLMHINGRDYRAVATAGDVYLGGMDWNARLSDLIAEEFKRKHRLDPRENPISHHRLLAVTEDAKRALTVREQANVIVEHAGIAAKLMITRTAFEDRTADLVERTRLTVENVLRDAKASWRDVTRILLVGGSTRMPMVSSMLKRHCDKPIDRSLSPDEAVAHGAAIYANILDGNDCTPSFEVTNVNSHALGVLGIEPSTQRPRCKVMIPRNTPLPATKRKAFKTLRPNQRSVAVKVIEGGDATGQSGTIIGQCLIQSLPPDLPAGTRVDVTFCYAADGRLTINAHLPYSQRSASLDLERSSGLSDRELEEWRDRLDSMNRPLRFL